MMDKPLRTLAEASRLIGEAVSLDELIDARERLDEISRGIMLIKNNDYTDGLDGDALENFNGSSTLGVNPAVGIMLRMQDKMQRIRTFVNKGTLAVKEESWEDACIDLLNYTILLYASLWQQNGKRFPNS